MIDIIAASLMTAVFVQGRDHLNDVGITASLEVKGFGFAWGSVGCLLFASFGFCFAACGTGGTGRRKRSREHPMTRRFWKGQKIQSDIPAI